MTVKMYRSRSPYLFFLLGTFATTSVVALVFGQRVLSLFTITLILCFGLLLANHKRSKARFNRLESAYVKWTIISIISGLFGFLYFWGDNEWGQASLSGIPKLVLYLLFFYLLRNSNDSKNYIRYLLSGLVFGAFINVIWAITDAAIYYTSGISITNQVFRSYIVATQTRYDMLSLVIGGVIRSGGLNGDPANIGMLAPILASYGLYVRKYWCYVIAVLGIFASVSIVALAAIIIITIIYLYFNRKKATGLIAGMAFVIIGTFAVMSINDTVSTQMFEAVSSRLEEKSGADVSDKDNARLMYWVNFVPAAIMQPTSFFIGTGYGTASYSYIKNKFVNREKLSPYDPEQTYFSTFFDCGLIGAILFVMTYLKSIKKCRLQVKGNRDDEGMYAMSLAGMEGAAISFLGYHYTIYSVSMLFMIAAIIIYSYIPQSKQSHK